MQTRRTSTGLTQKPPLCMVLVLILAALCTSACGSIVAGGIPPSTFQFHSIIPHSEPGTGGWKVAQVNVMLGRISKVNPDGVWCDVEIGAPEVNWKGLVLDSKLQIACAQASDRAARFALRQRAATSAALCTLYRNKMLEIMTKVIPGVDVTKFKTPGIKPQTFP